MRTNEAVIQAVEALKSSEFGATGIKVELEALLRRGSSCSTCGGSGRTPCLDCDGTGRNICQRCDGDGDIWNDVLERSQSCRDCHGAGGSACANCEGNGHTGTCTGCNGRRSRDFSSTEICFQFLIDRICQRVYGQSLAERKRALTRRVTGNWTTVWAHDDNYCVTDYKAIEGLAYADFYNDPSVDSEFTFTVKIDNPENVLLIPKIIEAFNDLKDANGGFIDVNGAGMHMAVVSGRGATYPVTGWRMNTECFENFRRSMTPLIPALHLLGTNDGRTRGMRFRIPRISYSDKYSTIYAASGALEFRVFDPVYDNPEAVLDNIVVMSNCVSKYWKREHVPTIQMARNVRFGNDNGYDLKRLFVEERHIDLLNQGLKLIKPSYYSVREIKRQRGFNVTRATINSVLEKKREEAEMSYREYEQRISWQERIDLLKWRANYMAERATAPSAEEEAEFMRSVQRRARERVRSSRQSVTTYITNAVNEFIQNNSQYELRGY